jgi:hypothetical protein
VELTGIDLAWTKALRSPGEADDRNLASEARPPSSVELTGIEADATSAPIVVDRCEDDADHATRGDAAQRGVSALGPATPDDAIHLAAKLAIDGGDLARARALLDLLDTKPHSAPLLALATRKQNR